MKRADNLQDYMLNLTSDHSLFEQASAYAYEYMDAVSERNVFPSEKALQDLRVFDEVLPEEGMDGAEMLRMLHKYGSPATVATTGARYFGMVTGGVFPPVMAAKWLIDTWDQNSMLEVTSPLNAKLEVICERWLREIFSLPEECAAGFVSGSSSAILCGLAAGRYALLKKAGWDVNAKGLFGAPLLRVVAGAEAHSTVLKVLALLGFGKERIELVPVDEQGRMIAAEMPELDERTLVVLQAGNVNSGSFDPLDEICELARAAGAWVHVDGAFGLWAAASEKHQYLTHGHEKADSWSVDAHKTLNTPYDSGIVLCREREALVSALHMAGSYILYSERRDGMLYTPEMSRRGRVVEIWATLKILGKSGVAELVDGLCERTAQFATVMRNAGFTIMNDVVYNQALVTSGTPEETLALLRHLQKSGECWCGQARWHEVPVIRFSVCSWRTTERDIERTVAAFIRAREAART